MREFPDKWVLGTGFVELWQRLHAADAALYGQRPEAQQLSYAKFDSARLSGCDVQNGGGLKEELDTAIVTLKDIYKKDGARTAADTIAIEQATQTLISVHRSIDDFRDQSRAGLARTRDERQIRRPALDAGG